MSPYGAVNEEKQTTLEPIVSRLTNLDPGGDLAVEMPRSKDLARIRLWLYEWLHETGLKREFMIKQISPLKLLVVRRGIDPQGLKVTTGVGLTPRQDQIMQELMEHEKPREHLAKLLANGEIGGGDFDALSKEIKRVFED